ncbi:MAG: hypothetical protein GY702_04645 [Desulfobulbaceae bacterium]|nr:hypothetical protein [Desulfobulbaceae bacterium]
MKSAIDNVFRLITKDHIACYLLLILGLSFEPSIVLAVTTPDICLGNTGFEGECKDCCDCLDDAGERRSCRDACIAKSETAEGFSGNTDLITVEAPSVLGPDYDYSEAVSTGNEGDCKTYCDESDDLACGDRRYCRDACNEAFAGTDPGNGDNNISIEQAISDEAQMKTIAFSSLAFQTGDLCSNTFFPPGKVSDFFGFQYLRDVTANGFGHNTEFAGRISDSVLSLLTETQVQALVSMANTQADQVDAYGYKRFTLIKAFLRLLENDLPAGTTGLDKSAVIEFTGDLYEIDAAISYNRAKVIGSIVASLNEAQQTEFSELLVSFNTLFENAGEGGTIDPADWPSSSPVDLSGLTVSDGRVLISTFATQLFSWYMGSVEGDTYFCPERHGTYFGSFYMKDIPPILASEAITIDTNLTADMGQAFLDALNDTQADLVTNLVDIQRTDLNSIVTIRQSISEKLRLFMDGTSVDEDEVLAMIRQYGEYEGEMMYHYATNFATVGNSLTDAQEAAVMGLRTDYYEEFPDYQADSSAYDCAGAWLYASKLDEMVEIENTDFLFGSLESVVADGAELTLISNTFSFAEGPASDSHGNLFFSDISQNLIYKWSVNLELSIFRENSGGSNGLFFDSSDNLLACEGGNQQIVSLDSSANLTVLADEYNNQSFNEPNDLWVTPDGGVYFTDPVYFAPAIPQSGEHVYYISPDRSSTIRVIADMTRPNGIIGTADGSTLYVTDHGAGETYQYTINSNGTLSEKQLFASVGADGMTIDSEGNVYLCEDGILVYNATGRLFEIIDVPEPPTNATFGGIDGQTLFITTRSSLYSLQMNVSGSQTTDLPCVAGDIDGNGDIDTRDAIIILQMLTGVVPDATIQICADVDNDRKIGIQEAIFILKMGF